MKERDAVKGGEDRDRDDGERERELAWWREGRESVRERGERERDGNCRIASWSI